MAYTPAKKNETHGSEDTPENVKPHEDKVRDNGEYESVDARLKYESSGETANDPNGGQITYIQNNVPDGQGGVKEVVHGPMPRSEWAEYSRKKGL